MSGAPFLKVESISKSFPGVQALDNVSFDVHPGEVHALVGENGAGKSTLMKILAGVYTPDSGSLLCEGKSVTFHGPADAQKHGIGIIYQEFNLLSELSVAENILLGQEPRRWGMIRWGELYRKAANLLAELETDISPYALVRDLTVAQQQVIEIVKAVATDAKLFIMDEPTAALNQTEVVRLFALMQRLRDRGKALVFISHRLEEVLEISDRVTVFKDGQYVGTWPTNTLTSADIVRYMVGRDLQDVFPPKLEPTKQSPLLSVRNLVSGQVTDVSFDLYPSEILGLAGLEGQGQRELVRALFGLEPVQDGTILIDGTPLKVRHPKNAISAGMVLISDDRKGEGLALPHSVRENIALPNLGMLSQYTLVQPLSERNRVSEMVQQFDVKTPSLEQPVRFLSGGNQQKAVLAKWMLKPPRVLLVLEPTRGIDVGAKMEIYSLLHQLASNGAAVLMVSSDLLELLGMCSRVLVMYRGRVAAELTGDEATEERVMQAATGSAAV